MGGYVHRGRRWVSWGYVQGGGEYVKGRATTKTRSVGKRAAHILLECFLVKPCSFLKLKFLSQKYHSYCWRLPSGWWRPSICPITNVQRQFVFVVQPVLAQWCQYIVRVSSWSNPSPLLCTFLVVNKWDEVLQSQTCFINAIRLNTTIIHFKDQNNLIFDVPKVPTLSLLFTFNVCFNNYRPQQ